MVDCTGKALVGEHENKVGQDRIVNSNMAISEAEMATAPVLLRESNIPEASIARRKPVELENVFLLFWLQWKPESGARTAYEVVCLHQMIL